MRACRLYVGLRPLAPQEVSALITIRAAPRLRTDLANLRGDESIVIDYYTSSRCGSLVGDVTASVAHAPRVDTYSKVADLDGIPVFAVRQLVPLLEETALSLDRRRLPVGRRLAVALDRPERWMEFLERPRIARPLRWLRGRRH